MTKLALYYSRQIRTTHYTCYPVQLNSESTFTNVQETALTPDFQTRRSQYRLLSTVIIRNNIDIVQVFDFLFPIKKYLSNLLISIKSHS